MRFSIKWLCPVVFVFSFKPQQPFSIGPSMTLPAEAVHASVDAFSTSYFKAKGTAPVWSITIAEDKIAFKSEVAGFESFVFPHVEPVKTMDANVKIYQLQTQAGKMQIEIAHQSCQISESREGFAYMVEVSVKRATDSTLTTFTGCGSYVTDLRLQDTWVLDQIKDKPVTAEEFIGKLPTLDIKANGNSFSGFAGCNTISGRLFSERNLLRFTDLVSANAVCDALSMETTFLQALGFSTQFKIEEDRLILFNPGGTTLILHRKV